MIAAVAVFALAPVVQSQAQEAEDERFTTGPPSLAPVSRAGIPPSRDVPDDVPSPPDGGDVQTNPFATSNAQNETSMAVNPNDAENWVGAANTYHLGAVQTGWYTTLDAGQTWINGTFGIDPGFSFSGDPCVTFLPDGTVVIVCMMYDGPAGQDRVISFRSTDQGQTWGSGVTIGQVAGYDKPQIEADLSSGPFSGRIAVAWDLFGFPGDDVYVSVSANGGVSYSEPKQINDAGSSSGISPDVCWGPNSELYVMWADRGIFDILLDRSFDGGVNFGADIKVADYSQVPSPLPGGNIRMFDIFSMHADQSSGPHSGNVYVAYHTWTGGAQNRADVRVATSFDGGATWPQDVKITSDSGFNDQVMPGTCVDSQGNVNVTFYDQRNDVGDQLLWTWVSRSSDGGATWTDRQISDVGWDAAPTEFFGGFIGDYIDIDCSEQRVHPFWCDGRSGSQDVYTDDVNLNLFTNVSEVSAALGGVVDFTINIGPNKGGATYLLVASGSGTSPGAIVDGVNVPLNPDIWTDISLTFAGSAIFPSSLGTLDTSGSATAQMDTLGPFDSGLAGTILDFSVVTYDGSGNVDYATAPTSVALVP